MRPWRSSVTLGIKEFDSDLAQARFNDLSHWGYGTGWGVVRGLLAAAGMSPRAATVAHGAAIYGAAQVTLPALEVARPSIFWVRKRSRSMRSSTPSTPPRRAWPMSSSEVAPESGEIRGLGMRRMGTEVAMVRAR